MQALEVPTQNQIYEEEAAEVEMSEEPVLDKELKMSRLKMSQQRKRQVIDSRTMMNQIDD